VEAIIHRFFVRKWDLLPFNIGIEKMIIYKKAILHGFMM
jgi:hypothetical protein